MKSRREIVERLMGNDDDKKQDLVKRAFDALSTCHKTIVRAQADLRNASIAGADIPNDILSSVDDVASGLEDTVKRSFEMAKDAGITRAPETLPLDLLDREPGPELDVPRPEVKPTVPKPDVRAKVPSVDLDMGPEETIVQTAIGQLLGEEEGDSPGPITDVGERIFVLGYDQLGLFELDSEDDRAIAYAIAAKFLPAAQQGADVGELTAMVLEYGQEMGFFEAGEFTDNEQAKRIAEVLYQGVMGESLKEEAAESGEEDEEGTVSLR